MGNKMNFFKFFAFFLALAIFSCGKKSNQAVANAELEQNQSSLVNDTLELEKLTKELYRWHETKSSQIDFPPLQTGKMDTTYSGIDLVQHKLRQNELKNTNLFAIQFLDNYNKIALKIDKDIRNKSLVYYVGELPPYGNDANPWCNCQDSPERYWEKIKIENIQIIDNNAIFNWTWGDNFKYKIKAIKENGQWKILNLEGFEMNSFLPR